MSGPTIPLVDLQAQHRQIADEVARGFARVIERTAFILGDEVASFETAFAAFMQVRHCIGVANGTDALELALRALDVGAGDEVIIPANTFIATALAVARAGATPVLVDSDPVYHLVDVERVAAVIGPRTKAILPVHLYGQMAPMEDLQALASARGVLLIEDAAQAQGAKRHGKTAGSYGAAAGTSFYPGKNLGAYGDAGAVLTNADGVAQRIRALRNYGSEVKYHHPETGFNSRLDTLQAVVLNAKLAHLQTWNEARREAARRYDETAHGLRRRNPAGDAAGQRAHLAPLRDPRSRAATRCCNACTPPASAPAFIIRFRSICRARSPTSVIGRVTSRWRSALAARSFRCRCFPR